jgi:hypothetical protein
MKKELNEGLVVALTLSALGYLIVIVGICVATVGFEYAFVSTKKTGIITEIDIRKFQGEIEHVVYVDYVHDRKQYNEYIYHYTDDMYEGKEISFRISKDAPSNIILPEGDLVGGLAVTAFGAVFAGFATFNLIGFIKKYMKKKSIIKQGRVIYATVDDIEINYNVRINYEHPFIICCSYQDECTGISYRFFSEEITENPTPFLPKGSLIPVYVNGRNYNEYHVDIEKVFQGNKQ